jgi:hypothetical protein
LILTVFVAVIRQIIKNVTILTAAITVVLALMAPAIFTTGVSAARPRDKACGDTQFAPIESDKAITIETSQDQYGVEIDYYQDTGGFDPNPYKKNITALEPSGALLLPGAETIAITVQSTDDLSTNPPDVSLYSNKVSDCEILFGSAKEKHKITLEVVDVQIVEGCIWEITVVMPDANDVGKGFTKLAVASSSSSESNDLYIISDGVQIS